MRHYCQSPSVSYTHNFFAIGQRSESGSRPWSGNRVDRETVMSNVKQITKDEAYDTVPPKAHGA